jgi:protein-glutamine gamma-glutamyltransferase
MLKRAYEYYRRLNRPGVPEESLAFRGAVLVTVLISVLAAVRYGETSPLVAVPVVLGVVAGSCYSYVTRKRANLILKAILTILLIAVFALFWSELTGSINDLRYPLVRLFLWLQVLHSFDLPTRRDLDFSLVSATILMAFAGSLSLSTGFAYMLIPFILAGLAALYLGHRSSLERRSAVFIEARRSAAIKPLALACLALFPLTLGLFMFLPRLPSFVGDYLPMSPFKNAAGGFRGLINNPGYKFPDHFPSTPLPYNPDAYPGFSSFMDLRVRGIPSDKVLMQVRSPESAYWRATAFDRFVGDGWENSDKNPMDITSDDIPLAVAPAGEPTRLKTRDLVQTFFIQRPLPNTVFAAYMARDIFFPTYTLKIDSVGTVLTPLTLDKGLIYTVISEASAATAEDLRSVDKKAPGEIQQRYCALPDVSPRVEQLARKVTARETNDYDRVTALCKYLKDNYRYDLNCPPQRADENSLEYFLFNQRRGFCEHFATALAVMSRTLDIPSRIAVGFGTGQLNPLTGYYEVSARDAHAWVEVYFPGFGWQQFDPTPGSSADFVHSTRAGSWSGIALFQYAGKWFSRMFQTGWGRTIKGALNSVGRVARSTLLEVAARWRGILILLTALGLGLLVWLGVRLRVVGDRSVGSQARGQRQKAAEIFQRMADKLAARGLPRSMSQTPIEYADDVVTRAGVTGVAEAARLFTRFRFGKAEPSPADIERLEGLVSAIVESLSRTKPAAPHGPRISPGRRSRSGAG